MGDSSIEWCDKVWNPTRGCLRVSPGCGGGCVPGAGDLKGGCYAERQAYRFSGPGQPYEGLVTLGKNGPRWTGKGRLVPEMLALPLRWKKPSRIFVNSMSDLFFEAFSNQDIASVFGVMAACPQHTFLILTKRAKRMREWFEWISKEVAHLEVGIGIKLPKGASLEASGCIMMAGGDVIPSKRFVAACETTPWPLPNVHLGVSVEDQEYAEKRIPWLLETPAAIRFLSVEPMLGPVDLTRIDMLRDLITEEMRNDPDSPKNHHLNALTGHIAGPDDILDAKIDWVICGAESGPGARPFHLAWVRSLRDQCAQTGAAFFCKQLGSRPIIETARPMSADELEEWHRDHPRHRGRTGDGEMHVSRHLGLVGKGNDMSKWPADLRVRQFPETRS